MAVAVKTDDPGKKPCDALQMNAAEYAAAKAKLLADHQRQSEHRIFSGFIELLKGAPHGY